ncbi:MAG: hypothetical protein KatS3mg110_0109 [Pirellulaceae bacterium]|nr:MAG: hypothetical protein KatS3mg110_0109 [Pirellulaceae bacterium]
MPIMKFVYPRAGLITKIGFPSQEEFFALFHLTAFLLSRRIVEASDREVENTGPVSIRSQRDFRQKNPRCWPEDITILLAGGQRMLFRKNVTERLGFGRMR